MDYLLTLPVWAQVTLGVSLALVFVFLALYVHQRRTANLLLNDLAESVKKSEINEYQHAQSRDKILELQQLLEDNKTYHNEELRSVVSKLETAQEKTTLDQRKIGELEQKVQRINELLIDNRELREKYEQQLTKNSQLSEQQSALESSINKEREHMAEKLVMLDNAEKRLATEFENIANKIFEQKSEKFTKTSETGLNQILTPLKSQLEDFKKQVNDHYVIEGKERASLRTEITSLKELNQRITEEAAALTHALKGDSKKQGNWGEIVLERLLEESGLRKGFEYEVQVTASNQEGKRFYPDVLVHLPNKKDVVIDSKVSLVAYERYSSADDDDARKRALKEHVNSIKGHIKGLSKKDYQDLKGLRTLDYVLMFVPIEAAFLTAVENEPDLIKMALENQIMIVSPTNLLVALRTIHNIWQYEYQHENAAKIAEHAKKIYDKFVGFLQDMEKIGKQIDITSSTYDSAMNKLQSGRGNIIRQLENFKKLGVNPTKSIDAKYVDEDDDDDTD